LKTELASLRHVDVEVAPGRGYRDLAARYARLGIERAAALVAPSFATAAGVVAAIDFVATLPASVVEVLGDRLGIRAVASPVRRLTVAIKLAWRERTDRDPAMRAFRDVVARALASRHPATRGPQNQAGVHVAR
jgi:DNA-binding transcriptional LysR family regulator